MYRALLFGVLGLVGPVAHAAPSSRRQPGSLLSERQHSYLQDDYYAEATWPNGGGTVSKKFYVSAQTVSPDGFPREAIVVTETDPESDKFSAKDVTVPGPTIEANFGDWVEIEVINRLKETGTSIHFHGIRQWRSNDMDGTPSITQCPIAPGNSTTYRWRATQYGTSWYHSHFGVQAWDGVFGPIVIHHPQSKEADHDLGPIMLSDWTHRSVEALYKDVAGAVSDSTMDNVLINGQNALADDATKGQRHQLVFEKGKTHRLRLINAAVDTTFRFSIDNHEMEVIAADFVPIVPYKAKTIQLSMGQRYDVLIKAGQDPKDYWLRAFPVAECQGSGHPHADNALAIVRYDAKSTEKPETKDWDTTDDANSCHDELMDNLVPALKKGVPVDEITNTKTIAWEVGVDPDIPFEEGMKFQYNLHIDGADTSETFFADWQYPTLNQYVDDDKSHLQKSHTIDLAANKWLKVIISNSGSKTHPIHLHGHDVFILAQTSNTTVPAESLVLNTENPPRRDVATLQPNGYLVLAIEADNPGAWLMHCHVGYHAAEGMAIQIAENMGEAAKMMLGDKKRLSQLHDTCTNWKSFQTDHKLDQKKMWEPGP